MADIPAICKNCGLIFRSGIGVMGGFTILNCVSSCPRCQTVTPILNGYTTIIDELVTFIVSSDHTLADKQLLIATAKKVATGKIKASEAERRLSVSNEEGSKLLREWATLGLTFLGAMAAVASFVLAYTESKRNAPLREIATEKFDEALRTVPQPNRLMVLAPKVSIRPKVRSLGPDQNTKHSQGDATSSEPPNENRKAGRAPVRKKRSKKRKR